MAKKKNLKEEALKAQEVKEGAEKEIKRRKEGHLHPLMGVRMNLLEVSHRDIEKIEKERFRIMNKFDDMEAINKFKDYVFEMLTGMNEEKLKDICK